MHRVADPDKLEVILLFDPDEFGEHLLDIVVSHPRVDDEFVGEILRIQFLDELGKFGFGNFRSDLDSEGVFEVAEELDMGFVQFSCSFSEPEEVCAQAVLFACWVLSCEGLFVVENNSLMGDVDGVSPGILSYIDSGVFDKFFTIFIVFVENKVLVLPDCFVNHFLVVSLFKVLVFVV